MDKNDKNKKDKNRKDKDNRNNNKNNNVEFARDNDMNCRRNDKRDRNCEDCK